jgi:hypothetical protein
MSRRAIVVAAVVAAFTAGTAGWAVATAAEKPMSGDTMKKEGGMTKTGDGTMKPAAGAMGKEPMADKEGSTMKKEDSMMKKDDSMKKDAKPAMEKKP